MYVVLCMSIFMYVHIYFCNNMYVKQDHHHIYLHSLSFIICCFPNRTINSDAHLSLNSLSEWVLTQWFPYGGFQNTVVPSYGIMNLISWLS